MRRLIAALISILVLAGSAAAAEEAASARGLRIARTRCATCHAIDKSSASPMKTALPFRDLHKRYPVETLEEALAEGIVTGHAGMPEISLQPDQVGELIAFLKTLE